MDEPQQIFMPTARLEASVNRVIEVLHTEYKMTPAEAIAVLHEAARFVSESAGVRIVRTEFIGDPNPKPSEHN